MQGRFRLVWILWILSFIPPAAAQDQSRDISSLSIEQLMQIQVTSVSRTKASVEHSAAAIYVITQSDIRRSGATSIPDLLRMVPGLEVAQINAHAWAISARGFNDRFSNKLLVMIDGRTVYSPLFSGVFWDLQDVMLEDVDRIEVIRGPGAALWGANAVNGVINIVTKKAKDTQGGLLRAGGGNVNLGFGDLRYGGKIGDKAYYRVFASSFAQNHLELPSGAIGLVGNGLDQWQMGQGGFRLDWDPSGGDAFTFEGDLHGGRESQQLEKLVSFAPPFLQKITDNTGVAEGDLLARVTHSFAGGSQMSFKFYFDRTNYNDAVFGENRNTYDMDFQDQVRLPGRQTFVWGMGYRHTDDEIGARFGLTFHPPSGDEDLLNAFAQDQFQLLQDHLSLTVGSKFEHNDFSGNDTQPNARLLWTPQPRQALWLAVSRAVRTPNRAEDAVAFSERGVALGGGLNGILTVFGDRSFVSEGLVAYEAGYRVEPTAQLSFDIASYFNRYTHLGTLGLGAPFLQTSPPPPHLILPAVFGNNMQGETYGIEIAANWNVTGRWRLSSAYTWLVETLHIDSRAPPSQLNNLLPGDMPRNQFLIRSSLDLPGNFEFDGSLQHVGKLPAQAVPSYNRFDTRLGWHPRPALEFSLVAQNLFDPRHVEFLKTDLGEQPTAIPRSVYVQVTCHFPAKR
ncbi:MAG TPA: TonB-dependent receptor [Candidatus Acidoferrales bacterium]|nr:TonB-dependent receptor [Candidatus Acidoferrales bacterium]